MTRAALPRGEKEVLSSIFMAAIIGIMLIAATFPPAYALYVADSQTVTTDKNRPVTFYLSGSAPVDFYFRVLTHPNVPDTCIEGYTAYPPACDHGYMEYNGETGQVWYYPNRNFVGTDSFTFETAAEMGPWSGDVIGIVTIIVGSDELKDKGSIETSTERGGKSAIIDGKTVKFVIEEVNEIRSVAHNVTFLNSMSHHANNFVEACQSIWDFLTL
jgi:hypothetical protein